MRSREIAILCVFIGLLIVVNSVNLIRRERVRNSCSLVIKQGRVRLSINTVSAAELEDLPGIGPVLAERIVQHRNQKGRFGTLEELQEVKGIGAKLYARICPYIKL
jgi:competence ComEA-like helix-hairpin-helix protein